METSSSVKTVIMSTSLNNINNIVDVNLHHAIKMLEDFGIRSSYASFARDKADRTLIIIPEKALSSVVALEKIPIWHGKLHTIPHCAVCRNPAPHGVQFIHRARERWRIEEALSQLDKLDLVDVNSYFHMDVSDVRSALSSLYRLRELCDRFNLVCPERTFDCENIFIFREGGKDYLALLDSICHTRQYTGIHV